jgi:hypothetical protein
VKEGDARGGGKVTVGEWGRGRGEGECGGGESGDGEVGGGMGQSLRVWGE